eukprot:8568138-Pyramimonas_sp.AAC.1
MKSSYCVRVFQTQELVAIKIVDARKFNSISMIDRIQEEIRILESIKHKNIVNMLEVLFLNDRFYFVMEYCEGGCMTSLLTKGRLTGKSSPLRTNRSPSIGIYRIHRPIAVPQ